MKPKILLIGGPTAVGKTALGIKCANMFNGEIISADSIQVYKHLDIGSAKATEEEQKQARHHLINILEPNETFSVADFKDKVESLIEELLKQNKLPIIVGGTGLFMKGLLFPYSFGNSEKNEEVRNKYKELAKEYGNEYVYNILKEKDYESSLTINMNDSKRVIRALEILETTGKKKSEQTLQLESKYDYKMIFLDDEREELYKRIDYRVELMKSQGLENEVRELVEKYGLSRDSQSMQGIGYKEFFDYFDNKITLDEVFEKIKLNTRHYAKRQITWFKKMPNVDRCNCHDVDKILAKIEEWIRN